MGWVGGKRVPLGRWVLPSLLRLASPTPNHHPDLNPCIPPALRNPLAGLLLREAVEDLEWTGGEVEFVMRRSPTRFSLQSIKQQSLEVRA